MTCTKISMRAENLSDSVKQSRNDYSRRYKERQRRARGIPKRGTRLVNPWFDPKKLYAYFSQWITTEKTEHPKGLQYLLNGIPLHDADLRYLNHLKYDTIGSASLRRVDILATRYDLPLWEIIDAAGRYKQDVRTSRRNRIKK